MKKDRFSISYVISTHNRLKWLKILFQHLLADLKEDEEIVVVDGGSTDGSQQYLEMLVKEGKIHGYLSESDKNQAQGWNKAILMAGGTIIKKIIDDDVFCYSSIRKCRDYMISHPEIDVLISNDLGSSLTNPEKIEESGRLRQYEEWKAGKVRSFTFGDANMLIRRSSLALIGLYNTEFIMMDWEYSLRISYTQANIAYYTGFNALSVAHDGTVSSSKNIALIKEQGNRGNTFYEYRGDTAGISLISSVKIFIGKILFNKSIDKSDTIPHAVNMEKTYAVFYKYINEVNDLRDAKFYT